MSGCIPIGEISVAAGTLLPERDPDDLYRTPEHTILSTYHTLLEMDRRFHPDAQIHLLDPGAGDGRWGALARGVWPFARIIGVERRDETPHPDYNDWMIGDYPEIGGNRDVDLIIGNPPFRYCEQFIAHGLTQVRRSGWVVFLLRLGFAGSQKRRDGLFRVNPPRLVSVCSKRPSFSGDGRTKPIEYAVYFWQRGYNGPTTMDWLSEK